MVRKGDIRLTTPTLSPGLTVDTLQQQFGNVIRRRRQELGVGQEALADKAGLHRTHVSLLERGKRMPSLQVVKKLAAALETTMASLVGELEPGNADTSPSTPAAKRAGSRQKKPG